MKPLLLAIFVLLTDPQGNDIYISREQVVAITNPSGCAADTHARLITVGGTLCVAEDPADVRRKLEEEK
jgi:hypothetical protein